MALMTDVRATTCHHCRTRSHWHICDDCGAGLRLFEVIERTRQRLGYVVTRHDIFRVDDVSALLDVALNLHETMRAMQAERFLAAQSGSSTKGCPECGGGGYRYRTDGDWGECEKCDGNGVVDVQKH